MFAVVFATLGGFPAAAEEDEPPPPVQTYTYRITFNANGGKGSMGGLTASRGSSIQLPANRFSKKKAVFAGWALTASGPVALLNKSRAVNLAEAGETAVLYAKWAKENYLVKFMPNGGTGKMSKQAMVYGASAKLKDNTFAKSGHIFAGWAKTAADAKAGTIAFANAKSVKNLAMDGSTVRLYAVWRKYEPKVPGRVRFALCQTPCGKFPASDRVNKIFAWADAKLKGNEDVIVFPELAFAQFSELKTAWRKGPKVWKKAAAFAKKRKAYVLVNHPTRPDGSSKMYNETRVFAPDGTVFAVYRKRVLANMDKAAGFSPGPRRVLVDLPFATLGLLICKDAFTPSKGWWLYEKADLLLVQFAHPGINGSKSATKNGFLSPASERSRMRGTREKWRGLRKAYMAVNKSGPDGKYTLCGGTFAALKNRKVVGSVDSGTGVLLVDFKLLDSGRMKPVPSVAKK